LSSAKIFPLTFLFEKCIIAYKHGKREDLMRPTITRTFTVQTSTDGETWEDLSVHEHMGEARRAIRDYEGTGEIRLVELMIRERIWDRF
jgi:hypothetical protein